MSSAPSSFLLTDVSSVSCPIKERKMLFPLATPSLSSLGAYVRGEDSHEDTLVHRRHRCLILNLCGALGILHEKDIGCCFRGMAWATIAGGS